MCKTCVVVIKRISKKYGIEPGEARDLLMDFSSWPFGDPFKEEQQVYQELSKAPAAIEQPKETNPQGNIK